MQIVASRDDPFCPLFKRLFYVSFSELQGSNETKTKLQNCISLPQNCAQNGLPTVHWIPNNGVQLSLPLPIRHTKPSQGRKKYLLHCRIFDIAVNHSKCKFELIWK